jgi:hypothetical protein
MRSAYCSLQGYLQRVLIWKINSSMSFYTELKRRNVLKVGIAYSAAAWLLLQIVDLVLDNINAPDWIMQVFILGLAVGLPIAIIAAWAFELTPEGVRLEKDVDPSRSIARHTGRQLNRGIIMILSMAIVLFLTERFRDETAPEPESTGADSEETGIHADNPVGFLPTNPSSYYLSLI